MFSIFKKSSGVLGMNARNLHYIRPFNLKRAKRLADDKLESKRLFRKHKLPTPKLLAKITSHKDLENFDWNALPGSFALKPARGFGGEGILVVFSRKKNGELTWIKADGSLITVSDLKQHIYNILEGSFSLSNTPDTAFFEERLTLIKALKPYTFRGIPDVRIIVFNGVPIMAMLRLPTKGSGGKANLQLGALGLGIDLASGTTTNAVLGKHPELIEYLPGSRLLLSGIKIPYWNEVLRLAVEAQKASKLGFLGADIAIDRINGPVFLELNSRPGLQIQLANLSGLRRRLNRVSGLKIRNTAHGIRVGKNLFGGEVEESLEGLSGKKVIGSVETITLIGKDEQKHEVKAKIDTGAFSTSIDTELARKLEFGDTIEVFSKIDTSQYNLERGKGVAIETDVYEKYKESLPSLCGVSTVFSSSGATIRPIVKITFIMDGETILSRANIVDRSSLQYPILIGRKDLKKFLIEIK